MNLSVNSRLISKILSPALKLWIRSQVQGVKTLDIAIEGKDRQILQGYVPQLAIASEAAIYRGLQLGRVMVKGENIRINMAQILKGQPLQLLEPIRVKGEVTLSQDQLQASLTSTLLNDALGELWQTLDDHLETESLPSGPCQWQTITLDRQTFSLQGQLLTPEGPPQPLTLTAQLDLINPKTLRLGAIQLTGLAEEPTLGPLTIDLGEDVAIETLHLQDGELFCLGQLLIRP